MCEVGKKGGGNGKYGVCVCECMGRGEWCGDEGKSGAVRISFMSLKIGGLGEY